VERTALGWEAHFASQVDPVETVRRVVGEERGAYRLAEDVEGTSGSGTKPPLPTRSGAGSRSRRRRKRWTATATRSTNMRVLFAALAAILALHQADGANTYSVRLDTSKGAIVIEVHPDWAPLGADRFRELVAAGYYDDNRFFRVVAGRWAQFGINGNPLVASAWRSRTIPDDPRKMSNVRGTVAFAFAVPNGRTTQVYIALTDLSATQDAQGFAPFGRVVRGMDVADRLNPEYGENSGSGIRAGRQQPLFDGGNAYLDREFPRLDRILRAQILGETGR